MTYFNLVFVIVFLRWLILTEIFLSLGIYFQNLSKKIFKYKNISFFEVLWMLNDISETCESFRK